MVVARWSLVYIRWTLDSGGRQQNRTLLRPCVDEMGQHACVLEEWEEEEEAGERRKRNLLSHPAGWFFWQFPLRYWPNTHTCDRLIAA